MTFDVSVNSANRQLLLCVLAIAGIIIGPFAGKAFSQSAKRLEITTLSSRPEFVSGGDALVEVKAPAGTQLNQLTLTLNGKDVTPQLKGNSMPGSFRGVISGMTVGENTLRASLKSSSTNATLIVMNYPIAGPILSGPHLTPYECRTIESGLGQPIDSDCSASQKIEYFYRASNDTFKPLPDPTGAR